MEEGGRVGDPCGGEGAEVVEKQVYFIRTNLSGDVDGNEEASENNNDDMDNSSRVALTRGKPL